MGYPLIRVKYFDYLGFEHDGYLILTQPCEGEDDDVVYCFIRDIDDQFNDKTYKGPDGIVYQYAEIRKSTEIICIGGEYANK